MKTRFRNSMLVLAALAMIGGVGAGAALANSTSATEVSAGRPIHTQLITASDEAARLGWEDSTVYKQWTDTSGLFTFTAGDTPDWNGRYHISDNTYRLYNGGTLSVAIAEGYQINSIASDPTYSFSIASDKLSAPATFSATVKFSSFSIDYINLSEPEETIFHVTYDGNGAEAGSTTDESDYEENDTVTVLGSGFTRQFYAFTGWNTKADGSGTSYAPGSTFNISSHVTLYAQWDYAETVLADGSYTAKLSYQDSIPSIVNVKDSTDTDVGLLSLDAFLVECKQDYGEYGLARVADGPGRFTFTNHTNAAITKVVLEAFRYDCYTVKADGANVHDGKNTQGADRYFIEIDLGETPAASTIVVEANNKWVANLFSVELFMKVGDATIHPESVSLNAEAGDVFIGKTRQMTATVFPLNADDRSVTWSSSDESVATVNDAGLVTGVAEGSATITVKTNDGELTATFEANVKELFYGNAGNPLTPEQAFDVLQIADAAVSAEQIYIRGVIGASKPSQIANNSYDIWLKSSDGAIAKYFELYTVALSIEEPYTAQDALVGVTAIAKGYGKMYGDTPELAPTSGGASIPPGVIALLYSAYTFADSIMLLTRSLCDAYVDESTYDTRKAQFTTMWSQLKAKYDTLSYDDVDVIANADADEEGTLIEQAMARYDYLTGKYELTNFITGRTPVSFGRVPYAPMTEQGPMIAILSTLAAVSALATVGFIFARKKQKN